LIHSIKYGGSFNLDTEHWWGTCVFTSQFPLIPDQNKDMSPSGYYFTNQKQDAYFIILRVGFATFTICLLRNAIGLKIDSPSYESCSIKAPTTSLFPQIMLRQPWFKLLKNFIKWESCIMPHTANARNYCKTDQFSTRHRKLRPCSRWIIAIPNSFHVE
jgi:hypothetical protein